MNENGLIIFCDKNNIPNLTFYPFIIALFFNENNQLCGKMENTHGRYDIFDIGFLEKHGISFHTKNGKYWVFYRHNAYLGKGQYKFFQIQSIFDK